MCLSDLQTNLLLLTKKREITLVLPRLAKYVNISKLTTPMKPQLDFNAVFSVEINANIAARPVQGISFTVGALGSRQANE